METLPIKCVVVGGVTGKTCLVRTYLNLPFPHESIPTIFDNYGTSVTVDGRVHPLTLWDTGGIYDYDRIRPLVYPGTNVVVLCYSTVHQNSFEQIREKWIPEVRLHCKDVPIILVGTKTDLRQETAVATQISFAEGHILAKSIGAAYFLECSIKRLTSFKKVFETAARTYLSSTSGDVKEVKENRKNCNLM